MGNSTEHTAFLRLKSGIDAPRSGSIALNGKIVAEQIGAQIFIDGWAMVAPGDPALAADLARKAASVSHAGKAIYGAQMLALEVSGTHLRGWANGQLLFDLADSDRPLAGGAIALICTEGRMATDAVEVQPA